LIAEVGYDRLSVEGIATRAGVGKAALYRRWPGKPALVIDAVRTWRAERGLGEPPDTGSLRGDLDAVVSAYHAARGTAAEQDAAVLAGLLTATAQHPELRAVVTVPREFLGAILQRAAARGEIPPDRDLSLIADAALGLNLVGVIAGQPLTQERLAQVLYDVVYRLATT
jgi:AcrR family transcriptional regulator